MHNLSEVRTILCPCTYLQGDNLKVLSNTWNLYFEYLRLLSHETEFIVLLTVERVWESRCLTSKKTRHSSSISYPITALLETFNTQSSVVAITLFLVQTNY